MIRIFTELVCCANSFIVYYFVILYLPTVASVLEIVHIFKNSLLLC